jgi:hypothetical protein
MVTFVQNNFFHDAFFLKAIGAVLHYFLAVICSYLHFTVLNGACNGLCTPDNSSQPRYHVRAYLSLLRLNYLIGGRASHLVSATRERHTNTLSLTHPVSVPQRKVRPSLNRKYMCSLICSR